MPAIVPRCSPARTTPLRIAALVAAAVVLGGCGPGSEAASDAGSGAASETAPESAPDLEELGTRYAAAWSSQDPDRLASFYAEDGVLRVNGNASSGRDAIRATAAGFMEAFPDMRVTMDSITVTGDHPVFHWHWTGTNTGPGGSGRSVDLRGYEEWTLRPDGLVALSDGHFDETEYRLQVAGESE